MLDSVRVRLTVWYTAVMACVLVVLAAAAYFVLRENSVRRADASMVELAESFLSTVNAEVRDASGAGGLKEGVAAAILEHRFRGTVFMVLDERGEIVGASEERLAQSESADVTTETLRDVAGRVLAEVHLFHTIKVHGRAYRTYAQHFSAGKNEGTLIVLQSLHGQEEFLESAAQTFALVIPLAVLLAGAGGYFLARRSLSPVVTMSAQAGRIGAENLDKRLEVKNSKDELGQLAQSFNDLLDRLDQSFERQRRFVADASHELRTPVAILFGEADVTLAQANDSGGTPPLAAHRDDRASHHCRGAAAGVRAGNRFADAATFGHRGHRRVSQLYGAIPHFHARDSLFPAAREAGTGIGAGLIKSIPALRICFPL